MASLSLFPKFMDPLGGAGVGGGDGLILALLADPDIILELDPVIEVEDTPINVDVDPDITIEVE